VILLLVTIFRYDMTLAAVLYFQVQEAAWAEIISFLIGIAISTLISVGVYKERISTLGKQLAALEDTARRERGALERKLGDEREDRERQLREIANAQEAKVNLLNQNIMTLTRDIGVLSGRILNGGKT